MIQRLRNVRAEISVPQDPEVWDLTSEEAGEAFGALTSQTAREILALLYDQPKTASELADDLDQSLQNIRYHLQNLIDANLVEVGDVEYSQKGNEMKIYVPTTTAVVLLAEESTATRIRRVLATLVGAFAVIGLAAILLRRLVIDGLVDVPGIEVETVRRSRDDSGAGTEPDTVVEIINPLEHLPLLLDPTVMFVVGAVFALIAIIGMRLAIPQIERIIG